MPRTIQARTTQEVLEHHLGAFEIGLDAILADYADDAVLISPEGTHRGLDGIRGFFAAFIDALPEGAWEAYDLKRQEIEGEVAFILWQALPWVPLGTDTFVVRDGKIHYQTFAHHRTAG